MIFSFQDSSAQNYGCYDSLLVSPGGNCFLDYEPVCACNEKTYRNYCYANLEGYQQYENGICEAIDFDFQPNPVVNMLNINLMLRYAGDANVYIMDIYGKVYYKTSYNKIKFMPIFVDVTNYEQGLYFIISETEGVVVVKKFMKIIL